jgi:hypothetical protein
LCRKYFRVEQSEAWDAVWQTATELSRSSNPVMVRERFTGINLRAFGTSVHRNCCNQAISQVCAVCSPPPLQFWGDFECNRDFSAVDEQDSSQKLGVTVSTHQAF